LIFAQLEARLPEAIGERAITVESCGAREHEMRDWLQAAIDAQQKRAERLRENVQSRMHELKREFPVESAELDARVEAVSGYRELAARLQGDDLPRHEERFRRMLREGTINDIALLRSQLDTDREAIERKLERINASLASIDYRDGSFITLLAVANPDVEVREFKEQLRACLGETLASDGEDLYTEAKFQQVKALVDRFRGREGLIELDARWRRKVTDVRQWLLFSASERWRADGGEREHYADSGGKSGGQKEKLAYTILASALIYQYGLTETRAHDRSFRFVVIDEAFGRGSDESARYALRLFAQFGLQLLVVTPYQKIRVIEDYVRSVSVVHNHNGERSEVMCMSIEEYHAGRRAFQARADGEVTRDVDHDPHMTQVAASSP
jgi:uncharacterized protein YPO0396